MWKNTLRPPEIFLVISNDILSPFSVEIYLLLLFVAQCANNVSQFVCSHSD